MRMFQSVRVYTGNVSQPDSQPCNVSECSCLHGQCQSTRQSTSQPCNVSECSCLHGQCQSTRQSTSQSCNVSECSCLHGQCQGGPNGNGKCVPGSCYASFRGENCELERKLCRRGRLLCHLHAECVEHASGAMRFVRHHTAATLRLENSVIMIPIQDGNGQRGNRLPRLVALGVIIWGCDKFRVSCKLSP